MTIPETIFAEALERLSSGETPQSIAADYKDYQSELVSLLSVAEMGLHIPKKVVPTPYKRHLFAEKALTSSKFMQLLTFMRFAAIPLSLLIALFGGRFAVDATENSLPGDKLYSIKRASENARLTLTRDQDKVATMHVELLQKRLEEVKQAANTGNEQSETAAIAELQSQTEKTFAEVTPVATANALAKQDSSLLNTLLAVNKEQKTVLASLSTTSDADSAKTSATSALEDNKKNDETLAKIIAAVNDQALIDLPNKISATGEISAYNATTITVEKNTFTINDKTIITNTDDVTLTNITTLTGRATVTGTRNESGVLIAKQITLLPTDTTSLTEGAVKGTITPKPTPKPITPVVDPNAPDVEPAPETPVTNIPTKATGSYITEPSTPQYSQ